MSSQYERPVKNLETLDQHHHEAQRHMPQAPVPASQIHKLDKDLERMQRPTKPMPLSQIAQKFDPRGRKPR